MLLINEIIERITKTEISNLNNLIKRLLGQREYPIKVALKPPTNQEILKDVNAFGKFIHCYNAYPHQELIEYSQKVYACGADGSQIPNYFVVNSFDELLLCIKNDDRKKVSLLLDRVDSLATCFKLEDKSSLYPLIKYLSLDDLSAEDFKLLLVTLPQLKRDMGKNLYIRALPLEGVDTKFLERNLKLIFTILKAVGICTEEDNDLEAFLNVRKKPKNFAHVRILDERLVKDFDYFQVSTSDLEHIALPGDNLLVVENVQSGLMLPKLLNTTVIFGCGNDVAWSKAKWLLSKKKIIYWGDLDSWGFFILSNFRKNTQAKVTSVMMDLQTLEYENHLAKRVTEKESTSIEDPALTEDEIACLDALSKQPNLNRLEQEKLDQDYIVKHLKAVLDE